MRHAAVGLTLMAICLPGAAGAQRTLSARVIATDPAGESIALGRDEPVYVRIAFTSDTAISIWARPYFKGAAVTAVKTNASVPHVGDGDALGWFSFDGSGEVDEIRIFVRSDHDRRGRLVSSYPVHVVGANRSAATRPTANWVGELLRQEALIQRQETARHAHGPLSVGDVLLMAVFMLVMLGLLVAGLAAPAWGVWKWRGGWRMAASVPAALMAFVVLRILVDTARDPTSHNLWPFEVIMVGAVSVGCMGALAIARRVTRANA